MTRPSGYESCGDQISATLKKVTFPGDFPNAVSFNFIVGYASLHFSGHPLDPELTTTTLALANSLAEHIRPHVSGDPFSGQPNGLPKLLLAARRLAESEETACVIESWQPSH